eukprot:g9663.t1
MELIRSGVILCSCGAHGLTNSQAFRDCEKQELQQMQVSLQKEAQEMLELCEMLEEEVQMLQEQLKRPPPLPSSAYSGQPSPPPRPPTTPPRAPVVGMAGRIPPSPSVVKALQDAGTSESSALGRLKE